MITTTDVFGDYGRYYDLLYRDKDYAAEADYVASTLRELDPHAASILEFGSGTGRHGRLLAERGFDVLGIERSASMVERAQPYGGGDGSFHCAQGDIRTAVVDRRFDAVISLFHVVCYQTTNADLELTFANAARHLNDGGHFLFDVWHGPAVLTERPSVRVKRVEDAECSVIRISEPALDTAAGVVTVRYTVIAAARAGGSPAMFEEEHRMRYLFPSEIDLLARGAGFTVVRAEEFVSQAPIGDTTFGAAYVLRKNR